MDIGSASITLGLLIAVGAGFVSFISPCVLPLVPVYVTFISGISADDLRNRGEQKVGIGQILRRSLAFVLGFTIVFVALGASATTIGGFLLDHLALFSKIAAIIVIVLGLHMIGLFRLRFLQVEKRFHVQKRPTGVIGALVIGFAFAFGWSPCVGPILAGVLALAAQQDTVWRGIALLVAYSLGLGIPFIIAGLAVERFIALLDRAGRYLRIVEPASGVILVIVGILLFTNSFASLSQYFAFMDRFAK